MIIANSTDWHLRGKDLPACKAQLAALVDECLARKVDLLTVAGDVFDRPSIGDNHASTGAIAAVAIEAVKRLTDHGIEVLMIPGNHDQSGVGSADALNVFNGMERVTVAHDCLNHVIEMPQGEPNITIICVPWSWGGEHAEAIIRNRIFGYEPGVPLILLAHIQVVGARLSGSHTCDAAPGKWQVNREFLDSLPVDHIALGDFHARQELVAVKGGYVGALRQCNFGEEGNPAGFEILNTETGAVEWVELDAAPKHQTVYVIGPNDTLPIIMDNVNNKIRVRYEDHTPDPVTVRQLEECGVQVEQIIEREERIRRADVPEGVLSDRHGLIRLWAEAQHPPVDGARLERMGRTLDGLYADRGGQAEA